MSELIAKYKKRRITKDLRESFKKAWWIKQGAFHYWAHFL